MTPPTDSQERLLLAAEELFADRGFDGVSVREICDRAGLNGAAVNYHFGDKERLYHAVVVNAHRAMNHSHDRMPPDGTPEERLRYFVSEMMADMLAPVRPCAVRLLMRELGQPSATTRAVVEGFIRPTCEQLMQVVGELLPDAPPESRCMVVHSIVGQCLFYRQNRAVLELLHGEDVVRGYTASVVADHVVRFSLAAVGLGGPQTSGGGR